MRPRARRVRGSARGVVGAARRCSAWRFGDGDGVRSSVAHPHAARGRFHRRNQSDAAGGVSARTAQTRLWRSCDVVRPSIAGSANAGSTLTCRKGTWRGVTPIQYAFRWRRNGRLITGARSQTFVVRQADAGALLGCSVVATNAVGSSTANAPVRVAP